MKTKWLSILLLFTCSHSFAQDQELIDQLVESLIEYDEELNVDPELLRFKLQEYLRKPLMINECSSSEPSESLFLNHTQQQEILYHRSTYGAFLSMHELQVLPSFNPDFIRLIQSLVSVNMGISAQWKSNSDTRLIQEVRITMKSTLPKAKGYAYPYRGSNMSTDLYYTCNYGSFLSGGIRIEKDAGESIFRDSSISPDYLGFYVGIKKMGWINNLIIGDFRLNPGQGLCLSNAYGPAKSGWLTSIKSTAQNISPYRSSAENSAFRGVALEIMPLRGLILASFFSKRKLDAYVYGDTAIKSLNELNGLHRVSYEVDDQDRLTDRVIGMYAEYFVDRFTIGYTFHRRLWDIALIPDNEAHNRNTLSGYSYSAHSIYYDLVIANCNLFGELSYKANRLAITQALLMGSKVFDVSILFRHFPSGYPHYYSQVVSENGKAENETGLFFGCSYKPNKRTEWVFHADIYQFPWLKYVINAPSFGSEHWIEWTRKWRGFSFKARYREEVKEYSLGSELDNKLKFRIRRNGRVHCSFKPNSVLEIRLRYEVNQIVLNEKNNWRNVLYRTYMASGSLSIEDCS